jgi:hypothetical protein
LNGRYVPTAAFRDFRLSLISSKFERLQLSQSSP